jgi:hypothetical protein
MHWPLLDRSQALPAIKMAALIGFDLVTILLALIRSKVRRVQWLAGGGVTFGWHAALTTKLDL